MFESAARYQCGKIAVVVGVGISHAASEDDRCRVKEGAAVRFVMAGQRAKELGQSLDMLAAHKVVVANLLRLVSVVR